MQTHESLLESGNVIQLQSGIGLEQRREGELVTEDEKVAHIGALAGKGVVGSATATGVESDVNGSVQVATLCRK
jgi:hypothetical protein